MAVLQFLDLIFYLCVEGLFCLCVSSLEAVRVRCRERQWREGAFIVQCDDNGVSFSLYVRSFGVVVRRDG
jgi:hypothetical protein